MFKFMVRFALCFTLDLSSSPMGPPQNAKLELITITS